MTHFASMYDIYGVPLPVVQCGESRGFESQVELPVAKVNPQFGLTICQLQQQEIPRLVGGACDLFVGSWLLVVKLA